MDPSRDIAFLRKQALFAELSEPDLEQLARSAKRRLAEGGALVIEEGSRADELYLVIRGELEVTRRDGTREVLLAVIGPGSVVGEMALVDDSPRSASVRAVRDSELLIVERSAIERLIGSNASAAMAMMRTIMTRLRSTEASLQQHAKMASLGTLAAGLAHELNNPVSAIQRGVDHLRRALTSWEAASHRVRESGVEIGVLSEQPTAVDEPVDSLSTSRAADLNWEEDRLSLWLEERGWVMFRDAPALVSCGWSADRIQSLLASFPPDQQRLVLDWLGSRCTVQTLLDEVTRGAESVAAVVRAVKGYTFLGEAAIQQVDVRESIENTLIILRGKLRNEIRVIRDMEPELPPVEGYGSELSQLWTNLIDNAIDAIPGPGTIEVRARAERDRVIVEVMDSGTGISPENQKRVFDPFFTTKPPGVGTGLGLFIAYSIVRKHGGEIMLESELGRTMFRVSLPVIRAPEHRS